jgi:AbiU2
MADDTADQVRDEILATMGPQLGPVYHVLWTDVAWLHVKWQEYQELYGEKASRVDILNRAAGLFFRIVQDVLWEDTLLHLARLTDPPRSAGKENLTVRQLPGLVDDADLRSELGRTLEELEAKTAFARDWRNRHIAHRDLGGALGKGAVPLARASRDQVEQALRTLAAVLNQVNTFYARPEAAFDQVITPMTGGVTLLHVLQMGWKPVNSARLGSGRGSLIQATSDRTVLRSRQRAARRSPVPGAPQRGSNPVGATNYCSTAESARQEAAERRLPSYS